MWSEADHRHFRFAVHEDVAGFSESALELLKMIEMRRKLENVDSLTASRCILLFQWSSLLTTRNLLHRNTSWSTRMPLWWLQLDFLQTETVACNIVNYGGVCKNTSKRRRRVETARPVGLREVLVLADAFVTVHNHGWSFRCVTVLKWKSKTSFTSGNTVSCLCIVNYQAWRTNIQSLLGAMYYFLADIYNFALDIFSVREREVS